MADRDGDLVSYYQNLAVAVWQGTPRYAEIPPFHPSVRYPEYDLGAVGSESNPAYEGVRACLQLLGLDREHFGTSEWNPFQEIVKPGNNVVIKPNFVLSRHFEGGELFAIITHPSVLRAIVDYVYKALHGEGKITIADAPQMDCDFDELLVATHLSAIQDLYWEQHRFDIAILDLRDFWLNAQPGDKAAYSDRREPLPGDPLGSVLVSLGKRSAFYGVDSCSKFYGADYNRKETIAHHHDDVHEYLISRTILNSDVIISVPKFKVHKKVGVTLNAKGLVGINTNKNYLVHYTLGTPDEGGDQFPAHLLSHRERLLVKAKRFFFDSLLSHRNKKADKVYDAIGNIYRAGVKPWLGGVEPTKMNLDGGNWYGNDSAWRMVVDMMRVILFADADGGLSDVPQRRMFSVLDGIVGGENNGPLTPDAKRAGLIAAGFNLLAVDIVGARLMGFDWRKLKWIQHLLNDGCWGHEDEIQVVSGNTAFREALSSGERLLDFKPHPGWRDYIEVHG